MAGLSFAEILNTINHLERKGEENRLPRTIIFVLFFISLYFLTVVIIDKLLLFNWPRVQLLSKALEQSGLPLGAMKALFVAFSLLTLIVIIILIFWLVGWIMRSFILTNKYVWTPDRGLLDWNSQGNVVVAEDDGQKVLHIIQSSLGCLVKNKAWRDYKMTFDFKVPSTTLSGRAPRTHQWERGFGIIYRARRLGEYYMIKVDKNGYSPHVRNVFWKNERVIKPMSLSKDDLDKWIKAEIVVKDELLSIKLGEDKFDYCIPTHSEIHRKGMSSPSSESSSNNLETQPYSKIPFRNYGTVGFRSSTYEEVFIKNLVVDGGGFKTRLIAEARAFWKWLRTYERQ